MLEKILVPVDSIKNSYTFLAVEGAVDFAKGCGVQEEVELVFLHVFPSSVRIPTDRRKRIEDLDQEEMKLEFRVISEICEESGLNNVRTLFKRGKTDVKIVETAEEGGADLIIMGSGKIHDKSAAGRINKFFYGSVTEKVVHEAPCSVLVVRPGMGLERFLVPVDSIEWDNTMRAIENAITFASGCQGEQPELIFMHVLHSPSGAESKDERIRLERGRIRTEFDTIKELCDKKGVSNVSTIVKEGDPEREKGVDEEIVETALEKNVDVVVMGSGKLHDRSVSGRVQKFVYGSVTEKVLHEAPCSILITRPMS
ncbi:hypothetical protein AKJ66_02130 [candidate division MSBL1 archaeon SCGC-AAA259E22]|nr:hypothetical protein AKJ66_02130 [candidate division MSBL1 archaeon SCGC-AAA259E22]